MTEKKMLTIEIDGQKIEAPEGARLIDVADHAGIPIPRFCYHQKLSIAASCRMCLVDIEKMPKPAPACATTISDGMVIRTRSEKARAAQKAVMEFLLINHPLDCPICDQGGECELQDNAVQFGDDLSRYTEEKRTYPKNDIGPLVETFMNRCIQCTRCVRYGEEIAGLRELGGIDRGDRLEISTYVERSLASEVSANIIDLCPVGALTAKPSKYQGRPWEYKNHPSISIHDGLGTNTMIHTLRGKIARVVSRENAEINSVWIADRDRFSCEANFSEDRLQSPMIMNKGKQLERANWMDALKATQLTIQGVIEKYGADKIGVLVSPSTTVEEQFLLKKLLTALKIVHVDSRFNQLDFSNDSNEPNFRGLGVAISEVSSLDSIVLVGADPRMEVPVLAIEVREAVKKGAKVALLNSYNTDQLHGMNAEIILAPQSWVPLLATIAEGVAEFKDKTLSSEFAKLAQKELKTEAVQTLIKQLVNGEKHWIVIGRDAVSHPQFSVIQQLVQTIAEMTHAKFGYFSEGANATGASLNGLVGTHQDALNSVSMVTSPRKCYLLVGAIDPELDFIAKKDTLNALKQADAVITFTPFLSKVQRSLATIALPIAAWGETDGSLVNIEGKCQSVIAASEPMFEAKPLWKVLRVLGNQFELEGFDYVSTDEILKESPVEPINTYNNFTNIGTVHLSPMDTVQIAIPVVSIYSTDAYTRRSLSLQQTPLAAKQRVTLNPQHLTEEKRAWKIGEVEFAVRTTEKMAKECIRVPREFGASVDYYREIKG